VTQLFSRHYQPQHVPCQVTAPNDTIDVTAQRSKDGKTLVLYVVNPTDQAVPAEIALSGYTPAKKEARVVELAGPLTAANTAARPGAIVPRERRWAHELNGGKAAHSFAPHSVTVITWE
jgi:alpha-L-arabinofuranosidase